MTISEEDRKLVRRLLKFCNEHRILLGEFPSNESIATSFMFSMNRLRTISVKKERKEFNTSEFLSKHIHCFIELDRKSLPIIVRLVIGDLDME